MDCIYTIPTCIIREKCIVFKKIDYKVGYKCP